MEYMFEQLNKIREYLVLGIIFLFPFVFAGTFIDQLALPKLILLAVLICLTLVVIAIQIYLTGKITIPHSKLDLPVFIIVVAYLLSAIFVTPNKVEAFFFPGIASYMVGFGIVYFLTNTITDRKKIKIAIIASSVVISLMIFASFLGVFDKIPQLPTFMKDAIFNPSGDYLTGTIFLIATIPFAVFFLIRENDLVKKLIFALAVVFILVATGISIFTLVGQSKKAAPLLPDLQTSWAVSIDTIRENPLLGVGPGNYLTAFNRFRPSSYNLSNLWQVRFSIGRDWYLTVITEAGLLGFFGVALLVITIINMINRNVSIYKESRSLMIDGVSLFTLIFILTALLVFPASPVTLLLLFVVLALNSSPRMQNISLEHNTSGLRTVFALILIGMVLLLAFKARPVILAESQFKHANDSLLANDGKKTYEYLQQAINLNPFVDRYHASYAQVNLAIARSIASSVKDAKDLKDDQKNTIQQLIQQAIREGQNTVSLNPTRAANWQVLANIYQVIIPYANQADQFAIQSYGQTISLDPTDPNLRIALGGLYYSLAQYDNAINSFQFAILAKPDLPNAYYNIAAGYAAKNDFDNAIAAMNKVISLLPANSNDLKLAQTDLDSLQKKQKTFKETNGSTALTSPQKQQSPAITPQLNLPEEASPPAGPKLPSATATPVATASPAPTATP